MKYFRICSVFLFLSSFLFPETKLPLEKIILPPGFRISVYAQNVPEAREMAFSPSGILFAGSRVGNVYAVLSQNQGGKSDAVKIIARGLKQPVGVAFYKGSLYISAVSKIVRLDNIEKHLDNPGDPLVVSEAFPGDSWHGWKFIRFGPDGKLYVPIGVPCNVCRPDDRRFGTISRLDPDGSGFEIFSEGLRNSVGFDWHPLTHELWFTDNGRDYMGDNQPPDELDRAEKSGMNFGFPYIHGASTEDPDFYPKRPPGFQFTPPEMELGPHVAALGMRFYTGSMFPPAYRNQIFIAEHGSWNRSIPIGYRVTLVRLDPSGRKAASYETFASGWLQGNSAWGRPVDVEIGPDGALYVSDDKAGVIYRIWYEKP